jgi:hypothetical protein
VLGLNGDLEPPTEEEAEDAKVEGSRAWAVSKARAAGVVVKFDPAKEAAVPYPFMIDPGPYRSGSIARLIFYSE